MEGAGSSDTATKTKTKTKTDMTEIATTSESLDVSAIFHIISEISGFVLYMHQQIPSVLQQITLEFDILCEKLKELEADLAQTLGKSSLRRKCLSETREARQRIRRFEKLMRSISEFEAALKLVISDVPGIEQVALALGASPLRPQHLYEISFSCHNSMPGVGPSDFTKTRAAEALSKKAIRALISNGAGSGSYPGTCKLFLLVKAPSSFSPPLHFLPKRDFRYGKKVVPLRVHFKTKTQACGKIVISDHDTHTGSSVGLVEPSAQNGLIWFQCRHVIKGIAFDIQSEE